MTILWVTLALSFLFGAIPFGVIFGSLLGKKDVRSIGSGNVGTLNVIRNLGLALGILTFVFDAGKGALFAYLYSQPGWLSILSDYGQPTQVIEAHCVWLIGLSAVLGHCYSPFLKGKGGKGVATTFGAFGYISWQVTVFGAAVFALVFWVKKTGSTSSLLAILSMFIVYWVTQDCGYFESFTMTFWISFIVLRHETNIELLINESERIF